LEYGKDGNVITCEKCGVCNELVKLYRHKYAKDVIGFFITRFLCPRNANEGAWEEVKA